MKLLRYGEMRGVAMSIAVGAALLLSSICAEAVTLHRGNGAEPDSLDPDKAQGTWENHIIGDMLLGLYTEDAAGKAIYGAAESHKVSQDGLVWTFKLRDHTWSDGVPVTADDFITAWRRILDPAFHGQYASLLYEFKNARDINEGRMKPEELAARAIDAKTIELTLDHPAPYLPQLLAHQTAFPVPKHVLDAKGDQWVKAGNYVSNGPYTLTAWSPNNYILLKKNPRFYDAANVQIDEIYYYPTSDTSAAFKRFRAGELDMQDGLSSQDIDFIKQNIPDTLHLNPNLSVSYIAINSSKPPLNDKRIREALSLAFDRDTMAEKILKFEEQAAYSFVPPGTAGYPGGVNLDFKPLSYEERVAKAKGLMEAAGYGPQNVLHLRFEIGTAPDNKRVGAAIQQMWRPIYVDVEPRGSESQVLYAQLRAGDFQVSQAAWVGDYNDAKNFLFLFRTDTKDMNYGRYSNPEFDRLMLQSDSMVDEVERGKVLAQAETIMLNDYACITNRFINGRHIVQTYVKGFVPNIRDVNRSRFLRVERPSGMTNSGPTAAGPAGATDSTLQQEQSWWDWFTSLLCSWFGIACPTGS